MLSCPAFEFLNRDQLKRRDHTRTSDNEIPAAREASFIAGDDKIEIGAGESPNESVGDEESLNHRCTFQFPFVPIIR